MGSKVAWVALALALFVGTSAAKQRPYGPHNTDKYTQREMLKNWALSVCIAMSWDKKGVDKVADDAGGTASGYFEYSNAPDAAFDEVRKLASKYAHLEYGGSIPGEFNTMKCIDLFHSDELDRVVKKYVKASSRDK
ncbi:Type VI secretion system (T6SS), amidase immunity protein [Andreprevotia lacus DSM 23236]|jgi:N6-adenosine-specific RNA methylase IME4|uniref:Type VI secretion system (T6SS), amidase immunity protein n=1 Tax=Andreprevotia lacus DSM 23236 TaxID=1121001 RepID=A0A1W1X3K6_9NEIS|nr:T6SS amidase immunity protein Tai4 family protein [Andreprevotia lacus]SMC18529.1 Type VI secretion system (T6SS), amidase immunity protein [Andreprevotia lacus DSM 23236]